MMSFEELVITIIGIRISQNDYMAQVIANLLLTGCIIILWCMSIWLGIEAITQEYRRVNKLSMAGVFLCGGGLLSAGCLLTALGEDHEESDRRLLVQIAEILTASIACLIWSGRMRLSLLAVITRLRQLFQNPLPLPPQQRMIVLPRTSTTTTTVAVITTSTSFTRAVQIHNAIAGAIADASGAHVLASPSYTTYDDHYTSETTVYCFTASTPFPTSMSPPVTF